jgi:hypothetical protein
MIHIGKEIKRVFTESGMKISVFSNKLHTVTRNVYKIFDKESIDTETLYRISEILQYDFFRLYISPKIEAPLLKNEKLFSKSPGKKISITIEVEEEKTKNQICKLLNIPQ